MKINYALVCYKQVDDDHIHKKHMCCYEKEPGQIDIDSLYDELATDEEFGMVGDTDFEMLLINREENQDLFELFNIPEEIKE